MIICFEAEACQEWTLNQGGLQEMDRDGKKRQEPNKPDRWQRPGYDKKGSRKDSPGYINEKRTSQNTFEDMSIFNCSRFQLRETNFHATGVSKIICGHLDSLTETCFHRIQKVAKHEWVDCANGKSAIHAWLYSKTSSVSSKQHT